MRRGILICVGFLILGALATRADIIEESRNWKKVSTKTVKGYAARFNRELDEAMKNGDYERAGQLADAYGEIFYKLFPTPENFLPHIEIDAIDKFRNTIAIGMNYMFTKDFSGDYVPVIPVTREYIHEHISDQITPFQEIEYIDLEEVKNDTPIKIVEYNEAPILTIDEMRGAYQTELPSENLIAIPEYAFQESQERIYDSTETIPSFPGGQNAMMTWLSENIQYPADAVAEKCEGKVIVRFVVEKDGSISNPIILKSVAKSLDQEALRIVNSMPEWTPGTMNGVPVRSYFILPITFKFSQ